jgi:hypothetical protein
MTNYSEGGAYVNFMMDEGQERVRATYRDNYERLARIKGHYDPREPVPREPEHPAGRREYRVSAWMSTREVAIVTCAGSVPQQVHPLRAV